MGRDCEFCYIADQGSVTIRINTPWFLNGLPFVTTVSGYEAELATVKLHASHPMFGEEFLNCLKFTIVAARRPFKGDDTPYFRDSLCNCFGSFN